MKFLDRESIRVLEIKVLTIVMKLNCVLFGMCISTVIQSIHEGNWKIAFMQGVLSLYYPIVDYFHHKQKCSLLK
jgi:hypothetical protein